MAHAVSTHICTYTSPCKYKEDVTDILHVLDIHVHMYREDMHVPCTHL